MKVYELRIGNLIKWISTGEIEVVKDIETVKRKTGNVNNVSIADCVGIELTEEWLIKFGFEKINNAWVIKNDTKIYNPNGFQFSIWKDLTYNTGEISPPLDFVHQLQNLYFALTGEELELKQ